MKKSPVQGKRRGSGVVKKGSFSESSVKRDSVGRFSVKSSQSSGSASDKPPRPAKIQKKSKAKQPMKPDELKQLLAKVGGTSRSGIGLYTKLSNAQSAAFGGKKPQRVMQTEGGYYAVVSPAVAAKLEKAGYEYGPGR